MEPAALGFKVLRRPSVEFSDDALLNDAAHTGGSTDACISGRELQTHNVAAETTQGSASYALLDGTQRPYAKAAEVAAVHGPGYPYATIGVSSTSNGDDCSAQAGSFDAELPGQTQGQHHHSAPHLKTAEPDSMTVELLMLAAEHRAVLLQLAKYVRLKYHFFVA